MAETTTEPQLPPVLQSLTNLLDEKTETLAIGNPDIRAAALDAAKFVFDLSIQSENAARPHINELISSLSPESAPQTRAQARANGKRKRSPSPPPKPKQTFAPTPLTALYVDGVDEEQIWSQLDLRVKNVCDLLELALEGGPGSGEGIEEDSDIDEGDPDARLQKILEALRNGEDVDLEALGLDGMDIDDDDDEDSEEDDEEDSDEDDEDNEDAEEEEGEDDEEELGEHITTLRDSSSSEDEDDEYEEEGAFRHKKPPGPKRRGARHSELDDDFFDLASFNAETQAAEAKRVSRGKLGDDDDDSDDDMSVDLFAAVDDVENFDEEDMDNNVGEAYYKDFFEPPPRLPAKKDKRKKAAAPASPKKPGTVRFAEEVRVKKIKSKGKSLPVSTMYEDDDDDDDDDEEYEDEDGMLADDFGELGMDEDGEGDGFNFGEEGEEDEDDEDDDESGDDEQDNDSDDDDDDEEGEEGEGRETIERLKDDLFADEEDEEENDLTTHEQRMVALKEQIASLEAENVGKKDWVLMGEATSKSRPQNSLLEEDLEFERTMKAVPVVTEDKIQALEDRIKARILEGRFDDVVRLRPINDKPFLPSRLFELQDTKSSQSLAQIYENDYVATQNGGSADDRDGKLKKEHEELEKQWDGICSKLDALCNAHFVPKQPKAIISTVANVSTTTLESALPTTKSASALLAPEEVFTPAAGDLRSKSEMAPAEKRAARNKERKSRKKTRDLLDSGVDKYAKMKGVKKQKQAALEGIVKTGKGVTVVGKKTKDILGKKGSKKGKSVGVSA